MTLTIKRYFKMRVQDIVVGERYRMKDHPNYCWAKVVEILEPKQRENTNTYSVVKCEYSQTKDDRFCLVKYFKPEALVKAKENP